MLLTFCLAAIIFQSVTIKNFHSIKSDALVYQSVNGQLGLFEEENQTTPTNILEEEEDDFNSNSIFLSSNRYGHLTRQFLLLQEYLFSEHHPEIVSPPPQG